MIAPTMFLRYEYCKYEDVSKRSTHFQRSRALRLFFNRRPALITFLSWTSDPEDTLFFEFEEDGVPSTLPGVPGKEPTLDILESVRPYVGVPVFDAR